MDVLKTLKSLFNKLMGQPDFLIEEAGGNYKITPNPRVIPNVSTGELTQLIRKAGIGADEQDGSVWLSKAMTPPEKIRGIPQKLKEVTQAADHPRCTLKFEFGKREEIVRI